MCMVAACDALSAVSLPLRKISPDNRYHARPPWQGIIHVLGNGEPAEGIWQLQREHLSKLRVVIRSAIR